MSIDIIAVLWVFKLDFFGFPPWQGVNGRYYCDVYELIVLFPSYPKRDEKLKIVDEAHTLAPAIFVPLFDDLNRAIEV